MIALILQETTSVFSQSAIHTISDIALWSVVALLGVAKGVDVARNVGFLPPSSSEGSHKRVGDLSIYSLRMMIAEQVKQANEETLKELREINGSIKEVAIILRERGGK